LGVKEKSMTIGSRFATLAVGLMIVHTQGIWAAEIKVLSTPLRGPVEEIRSEFERTTGHKLQIKYGPFAELQRQIDAGEEFDVIVSLPGQIDELVKQGKVTAGTRVDVARAGLGVAIKKGAPKLDISSTDAFKNVLLNANSIAYAAKGPSGKHLIGLIEQLGISAQTKPKLKPMGAGSLVVAPVAKGEVDIGVVSIPFILAEPGAELLAPLPLELQHYVVNSSGIGAAAKDVNAAKAFVAFFSTPSSVSVLKANGLEPVAP
jgi:molybdate transport system substrate-binding protein